MKNSLILFCVLLTSVALLLAGCSSSSDDDGSTEDDVSMTSPTADGATPGEGEPIVGNESQSETERDIDSVLLSPETAELAIGQTQQFTATPVDANGDPVLDAEVVWESIEDVGSITKDGVLTVGTKADTYDQGVKAIATLNGVSVESFIPVTINPGPPELIAVAEVEIVAGATKQLEVAVTDEYGNSVGGLEGVWTISDANAGTITETGLLVASEVVGGFIDLVQVEVVQDGTSQTAVASVTIIPGPLEQLIIAPDEVDIGIEMTQQFVAVGVDQFGNRIPDLSLEWSVENGGGTIDNDGLFTANNEPDLYKETVKVTAAAGEIGKSMMANVTVEPDRIAFVSDRKNDTPHIYTMDIDGNNIQQVTTAPVNAYVLSWSPDGRRIAWDAYTQGYSFIVAANDDGTWGDILTTMGDESECSWSPDGTKFAYTSWSDETESYEVFVMDIDGGNVTQITSTPNGDVYVPTWSPDGGSIVYDFTPEEQNGDIYVVDADGSNSKRLTHDLANDTSPVYSPDGSKIAFASDRNGNSDVYVMNANGSGLINLTQNASAHAFEPDWSLDGSQIVFVSNRDSPEEEFTEVYVIKSTGGVATRLTNDEAHAWVTRWAPRKSGLDLSKESIVIPNKSELARTLTVKKVTAEAREAVVKIETDKGTGSGFIIASDGLIMTNNHVIVDAEEITVYLDDGSSFEAKLRSREMIPDIALLEIEAEDLPYLELGDVGTLDLGEQVVVLGYPLASDSVSVTSGFVSSVDFDKGKGITWVKTDSAISPGNSGGPLLNLQGQVVGVISLKMVSVAVEGIGYAVSANTVEGYLPSLLAEE